MAKANITYEVRIEGTDNQEEAWEEAFEFADGVAEYWRQVMVDGLTMEVGTKTIVVIKRVVIDY